MVKEKILITGGTGFIGGNLVRKLFENKYEIKCLVRKNSRTRFLEDMGVELAFGDITDKSSLKNAVKDVSVIFHLAGILGKWRVPNSFYTKIHIEGTQKMLETCIEQEVRRFIYCSTSGVLGPIQNPPADEKGPYNPSNIYEYVKTEAEKAVLSCRGKLAVTVIRPGFVYGPRDMHTLHLFKSIKKRRFFIIGDGKALLHPTYIEDLNQGFILCLENRKSIGEVYLIVGEKYVTVKEFIGIVSKNLCIKSPWIHVPIWSAKALAGMAELAGRLSGFEPPLTSSRVKFFTENRAFSYSKAERDLGYKPIKLEEGIRKTIMWYCENGYL